jgi:hypothetical protein
MRGMPYSHSNRTTDTSASTGDVIREALAIQAANRKPLGPAKLMPKTPTLPKVMKYRKQRRKP